MHQRTHRAECGEHLPASLYPLAQEPEEAGTLLPAGNESVDARDVSAHVKHKLRARRGAKAEGAGITEESLREHLPMVRLLALRLRERLPQQVEMEDLISAGIVGLIDAMQKFDPEKKVQFRSYAQFRVRGAMLDSLRALDWGPRDLRRKGRAVEEAIRALSARQGKSPSESEIANEMGLELAAYQQLLGELSGLDLGSLNAVPADESGVEALLLLPAGPEDDPFLRCQSSELRQRLGDAISALPERERMVLTLYYYEELTMREVGAVMGIVESRVSQLHTAAMSRLRVALRASSSRSLLPS